MALSTALRLQLEPGARIGKSINIRATLDSSTRTIRSHHTRHIQTGSLRSLRNLSLSESAGVASGLPYGGHALWRKQKRLNGQECLGRLTRTFDGGVRHLSQQFSSGRFESFENAGGGLLRLDGAQHNPQNEIPKKIELPRGEFRTTSDAKDTTKHIKRSSRKTKPLQQTNPISFAEWGFIRHQVAPEDRPSEKIRFTHWKKRMRRLHGALSGEKTKSSKTQSVLRPQEAVNLLQHQDVTSMRREWEKLGEEHRKECWENSICSVLRFERYRAHQVLDATLNPLPPGYAIHDVLETIARHISLSRFKSTRERVLMAEELLDILTKVIEDLPPQYVPLRQTTIGRFASKLPADQARELYATLHRNGIKLHYNTQLQFARTLAKETTHKDAAFEILKIVAANGLALDSPKFTSVLTSLLHCKANHEVSENSTTATTTTRASKFNPKEALEYFVERGVSPNVISFTAFLDSLCQDGQVDEATRLSLLFAESGVELDNKAWATVFRGAKYSLRVDNVVKALDVAKASNAPYQEVLNNALHSILYFASADMKDHRLRARNAPKIFPSMLRIYAKKFDLRPLQLWLPDILPLMLDPATGEETTIDTMAPDANQETDKSIFGVIDHFFALVPGERLQPSMGTIAIMLRAYIRDLREPYELMAYYTFFKSCLESGGGQVPHAQKLLKSQGSLIHDAIILSMVQIPGLSRPALQVFGDMLKDQIRQSKQKSEKLEGGSSSTAKVASIHPEPSVFTFSILIHGLFKRGEKLMAEQVLQVMREHDIEPNIITWNTLIRGYASTQSMDQTVSTLQDMEAAGHSPDSFTFKAFGKLKRQEEALKKMEGIIDVNRKKLEEDDYGYGLD